MSQAILAEYDRIVDSIQGYASQEQKHLFHFLLSFQRQAEITGNLMEIGVLFGKSGTLMGMHSDPSETAIFCDIKMGEDVKALLRERTRAKTICFEQSCYSLSRTKDLAGLEHSFRFIHIDGGHLGGHVYNDLKLADEMLAEDGIICLDDFFSAEFPQITEAVFSYLAANKFSLTLILTGFRKAFLARPHACRPYLDHINSKTIPYFKTANLDRSMTLFKTSFPSDMNCFGIEYDYAEHGEYVGIYEADGKIIY